MSQTSFKSVPEGSDNEFWADLSVVTAIQKPGLSSSFDEGEASSVHKHESLPELPIESSREIARLTRQIDNLRKAKEVEIKNAEIVLRRVLQVETR